MVAKKSSQPALFDAVSFPPDPLPWEVAAENDRLVARLVFNRPIDTPFDYLVPDGLRTLIAPGQRVKAPFGKGDRLTVGYCVALAATSEQRRLKTIDSILDRRPLVSESMLRLTQWIADYYLCSWGQVLESVVPAGVKQQAGTRLVTSFVCADQPAGEGAAPKLSAKQKALLEVLATAGRPMDAAELTQAAECGTAPLAALRQKGLIRAVRQRQTQGRPTEPPPREDDLALNADQQRALDTILGLQRAGQHRTVLLHGVTGSGKTEVYIQAIREVVSYGRQAIVLVPEISLTPQTIRRFRRRFASVAVLHSHLSDAERHWHWQQIASGSVEVVIGARSAVFAPTPNLGLIVIDEEHETTFKQETTPRYHAREVARQRAQLERIPLILGSATPTLESWLRVQQGQDTLVSLPKRVERRPLPPVIVVDVRNDPMVRRGAAIGRALEQAMRHVLHDDDAGQIILFLNLRGFSPAIWCRSCGASVKCPTCDVTLAWHKDRGKALCHVCDYECDPPAFCPGCSHAGLRYVGIGTQRLEQEVRARFAGVACVRMDSDAMRKRGSHDVALEQFRHGHARILLGTQMIAKGLDFPNVTLVGVVNADTILHQPDFRASERTFQLISQVSGRTGRGPRGGRVLVQTSVPDEPSIVLASKHDFAGFVKQEWGHRQALLAPPARQFTRIIIRGEHEDEVREEARRIATLCSETAKAQALDIRLLGPAPAPISRIKGQYRFHVMLAAPQGDAVRTLWRQVASQLSPREDVEWTIDVDPINLR